MYRSIFHDMWYMSIYNLDAVSCLCFSLSPQWPMNVTSWRSWRRTTTTRIYLRGTRRGAGTWLWKRTANPNWVRGLTSDRRPSSFCPGSWVSRRSEDAPPPPPPLNTQPYLDPQNGCGAAAGWILLKYTCVTILVHELGQNETWRSVVKKKSVKTKKELWCMIIRARTSYCFVQILVLS